MKETSFEVAGVLVSGDHYINGERVPGKERFVVNSPIDQRVLGEVSQGSPADVEHAIVSAQMAFPAWAAMTAEQRKPILDRFAAEIGKRAEAFGALESNDAVCSYLGCSTASYQEPCSTLPGLPSMR